MQSRRVAENSGAIYDDSHKLNNRKYQSNDSSDSSDEYEEETHISYQFRRWANHIWSVSNNVTSRLRDLLGNHPSSNTTSNQSGEESCEDESNPTSCTTSSGIIESSNRISNEDCKTRRDHHTQYYHRSNPKENYSRCGQKFSHVTEGHRMRHVTTNRVEMPPNFMGHGVTAYPPVLILPRLHQGVNRQPMDTGAYQSRKHMLRCHNMHGDERVDGWYRDYHHLGKCWGSEGSGRGSGNYFALLDCHENPKKLSPMRNDRMVEDFERKPTWTYRGKRKTQARNYGYESANHFSNRMGDFHSQSYGNGLESLSPIVDTRRSREKSSSKSWIPRNYVDNGTRQNFNHSFKSTAHTKAKNVVWDLQLSDITSQEPSSVNPSRIGLYAKSSITLNIEKKRAFLDQNLKSTPAVYEDLNVPVKDDKKFQEIAVPSTHDINTLKHLQISDTIQAVKKNNEGKNDDLVNGKELKWSSVTENSVDLLLQSLRERMDTLANAHSLDTRATSDRTECNGNGEGSLTKECIVASCLAGTYLPQCLERENKVAAYSDREAKNEEIRPSFSDRIQDIWRDGKARVWRSSPRHQTSSSRYKLKTEKDLPSKLSLLGLNQQPVLREYFGEYNNAVTLARILEKLIDSKSKSDIEPSPVSPAPKPPPRLSRKQSKTCIQVNVGVQKSAPTSTTSSQDRTLRPRRRFIEKQRSRRGSKRNFKPRVSELTIETPRPLQVFSGQSIIPISSIQFTPVIQPLSNFSGFPPPPLDLRSSFNCYEDPGGRHGHSIIIDNPVFQEANAVSFVDTGLKCSSFFSNRDSPSSTRGSSFTVKEERLALHGIKSLNEEKINRQVIKEQERILSLVLGKIEHKRQCAQRTVQNTDVSQQRALHHSTPVRHQESRAADDTEDPTPRGMSTKSCSWWKKKFRFNKSSILKVKMASILKYVTKRQADDQKHDTFQKYALEKARNENVVPIPPVRVRRRSNALRTKSNKSIQWEFNGNVSRSIQKIDSFQVTENQQSSKSTSVCPIIRKVFVTSGTNTNPKKSHKTSTKLSSMQNRGVLVSPEIIQVSEEGCTDFSDKLLDSDRTSIETDIVADAKEKYESSSIADQSSPKEFSFPVKENFISSSDTSRKAERDSIKSNESKVSRSLSSKIPLAVKPVIPFNASLTISGKRPSTAPILENLSSDSSRSNAFLGESDDEKSFSREFVSHETAKKMLFKHNRSSLLRANNSISRKCAMGQSNLSRKLTGEKNTEKNSISKLSASSVQIDEEKASPQSYAVKEIRCNELASKKHLHGNKGDTKIKGSPSADNKLVPGDFLGTHSKSPISECQTKERVTGKISSSKISGAFPLKTKDLTHNEEIINLSMSSARPQSIDPKHSLNKEARNLPGKGKSICRNLEHKDKRRSSKSPIPPLDIDKEKDPLIVNWESTRLIDNESTISIGSTDLKEENRSRKNPMSEKDVELPTRLEVSKDAKPRRVCSKESKGIESNKICLSNLNVSQLQSDKNCVFIENSSIEEQPEDFFYHGVAIDNMKTTLNEEVQLQLAYSTSTDVARKLALRNREINTLERSRRPCFQSKSIPSSTLSPQHSIGKSSVKGARLLCKNVVPSSMTVARFNSANNERNANLPEVIGVVDDPPNQMVEVLESQNLELLSVHKTLKTRVAKSTRNSKQKLTKICKTRNKNTEEVLEVVLKVIDIAINESIQINRITNLGIESSKLNILQGTLSNSKTSSELLKPSLKPIRNRTTTSERPPKIGKRIRPAIADEVDARRSLSCSSNQEKELENICIRKQQLQLSIKSDPKMISEITIDQGQHDCGGIQSSKKFLVASKPFPMNQTSGESALLKRKSGKVSKNESEFILRRSRIPRGPSDKTTCHDSKIKINMMPPKMVTDEIRIGEMPFEMEYQLTQSTIIFDSVEILDKPEKLRPLMFDVQYLQSGVEFVKSKLEGDINEKNTENRGLFDIDSKSRVMDDENSGKSTKGGRNVEIDNKVLEEKVKCSIENGVPLKTITITDPFSIKHDCLNDKNLKVEKIEHGKDLPKMKSQVQDKLPETLHENSQYPNLDAKIEGEFSHTTWTSHKNRDTNIENKTVLKTPPMPENIELCIAKDLKEITDKSTCAVRQDNLVLSIGKLELDKKPARQRGTLIPRYKRICLSSLNGKNEKRKMPRP